MKLFSEQCVYMSPTLFFSYTKLRPMRQETLPKWLVQSLWGQGGLPLWMRSWIYRFVLLRFGSFTAR